MPQDFILKLINGQLKLIPVFADQQEIRMFQEAKGLRIGKNASNLITKHNIKGDK